jgi:hypothetical protein
MMVPPKDDPRWKQIVLDEKKYNFSALPTKMLMMRLRLLTKDNTPQKIEEAIDIIHDFFSKNVHVLQPDICMLFESKQG